LIIQIIGLPGAGKTALATALKNRIKAIHLNADEIRATVNSDLSFSIDGRMEQARRLGEMARLISNQGFDVLVDFVCPTIKTREKFGKPDILIWVDRIEAGRFEDTNLMWESPTDTVDLHIPFGMTIEEEVQSAMQIRKQLEKL
jgi:adenylylsulfate kinase